MPCIIAAVVRDLLRRAFQLACHYVLDSLLWANNADLHAGTQRRTTHTSTAAMRCAVKQVRYLTQVARERTLCIEVMFCSL